MRQIMMFGLGLLLLPMAVKALPGQTSEDVADWIKSHPVLRPGPGERLWVRKSNTPARRFQFQASSLVPGRAELRGSANLIRSERLHLFDLVAGVTRDRLEELLRSIYGPALMEDYRRAVVVFRYPQGEQRGDHRNATVQALRGELRRGEQFSYWLELVQTSPQKAISGQITVFATADLEKLQADLSR
jgi:hypothetical protein